MKLAPVSEYTAPHDEAALLADLARGPATLLAGGQSLVPSLAMREPPAGMPVPPSRLIDLNRVKGADRVEHRGGTLVLGAMVRHARLARDPLVQTLAPMLAEAALHIGNAAIRNRGTFGGALAWGDPTAEWPLCAVALGATLVLRRQGSERRITAKAFFTTDRRFRIDPGEWLAEIHLPASSPNDVHLFEEIALRPTAPAIASLAVTLQNEDVVMAANGPTAGPVRLREAAAALARGAPLAVVHAAAQTDILAASGDPGPYQRHLLDTLISRAVARLPERSPQ